MTHLLDTNVCIAAMRGNLEVVQSLQARSPEDCAVSTVSVFELFAGVFRCNSPEQEKLKVTTFLEPFHLLPFDWDSAVKAAEIRYQLEKIGTKIGPYDLQLSGQALSLDLTFVTHNTREFNRITGLRLEDWEREGK
ncbi:MAG: type II toxin-antitoxin system VapC family toxin [Akkermansiaceae bacterium]|nr:type II toxin-antitoxin system VapC family toxin [Akkermansiaceae bacterium]